MSADFRWNFSTLFEELKKSNFLSIKTIEDISNVGLINFNEYPELNIYVGVDGKEIQFSVLIEPVHNVSNFNAVSSDLLRINKKMHLSTFGITEVNDIEWYEIFGQMSSSSSLNEIYEELNALVENTSSALELFSKIINIKEI